MPSPAKNLLIVAVAASLWLTAGCDQVAAQHAPKPDVSFVESKGVVTPFKLFNNTRIFIPASINGHAAEMLLDSGASMSVLDKAYADRIGVEGGATFSGKGVGGAVPSQLAIGVSIEVASVRLKNMTVAIMNLSQVANGIGHPINAILGREILDASLTDLDLPKKTITFHDPGSFKPPSGAMAVPLLSNGSFRSVPISISGRPPIQATLDLGNGSAMMLGGGYVKSEALLEGLSTSQTLAGGAGGMTTMTVASLPTLSFAGQTFNSVPVMITQSDKMISGEDANLGMDVLNRFHLFLDYSDSKLYVIPDADALKRAFTKNRSGIRAPARTDRLKVQLVSPGSPAEAAGWKVGEEIVAVDGVKITPDFTGGPKGQWSHGPSGTVVELTMADGSKRQLTLKDYY